MSAAACKSVGIPANVDGALSARSEGRDRAAIVSPASRCAGFGKLMYALPWRLVGADDLEVLVDEDVVRPVDADIVDLVLTIAQLHHTVDNSARVGGQRR